VLAGGSRLEDKELLTRDGAGGERGSDRLLGGRNIFMHASPEAITRALSAVIRERWTREKAYDELQQELSGMRAAFMTEVNAVDVGDAEEPKLDPAGADLKVEACGICGTDARTFFNGDPKAPVRGCSGTSPSAAGRGGPRGRPAAGVTRATGVPGLDPDVRRVPVVPRGFQNLCEHHLLYGYDPFPGAYADYAGGAAIATKNLIPLPHDLPIGPGHGRPTRSRAR
jgi:hypothetical protein